MQHIFLIGFMGSGKSFTGRRLARRLGLAFIDLDERIEQLSGRPISRIFAEDGEAVFRRLEAGALRALATAPGAVVACGGGTPCFSGNIEWMNRHGVTVYLDTPVEVLARRLAPEMAQRPLLHGLREEELPAFITERLRDRETYYRQAGVIYRQHDPEVDAAEDLAAHLLDIVGH